VYAQTWQERADWTRYFEGAGVRGTIAVAGERSNSHWICNQARASQQFLPASTFKIPHALIALDAGIVRDEFQVFRWDGKAREVDAWNRDQTLRSSVRYSTVWVYQQIARQLGERRERGYLQRLGYGNTTVPLSFAQAANHSVNTGDSRIGAVIDFNFVST